MTDSDLPVTNPTPTENQALPLEELELTPQWVKSSGKVYAEHSGQDQKSRRDGYRPNRERPDNRDRGDQRPRPPRQQGMGDRRGPRPEGPRPAGPRPEVRRSGPPQRRDNDRRPAPSAPPTLPVEVTFQPEDKGFAAMIEAMKQTTRAYTLFDIAKLVLNKPERHLVKFARTPAADGTREPLFLVMPSENICLRQDEAARFAFRQHGEMIFREKKTTIDPPKGNFTFVNRCGFTGVWLGPPNYHEYQGRLVRHHQQRLRHIPFDEFKSRIQTVRDPEAVQAWLDYMSAKTEYECILDAEPKAFASREELEKHFVETHLAQFVTTAPEVRISGAASRKLQNPSLLECVRLAWQQERKFPLKTANEMRGRLRHEGFHFFKDPKGITHISRIKPQRFESIAHLSEQIQKIIVYLREHFGCTRKQLLAHFVPQPAPETAAPVLVPDAAAPPPAPTADAAASPPAAAPDADAPAPTTDAAVPPPPAPAPEAVAPAVSAPIVPSEQDRLLADLHWLIQDGYVADFSDGRLWALADRPPQPAPAATPPPAPTEAPAENAVVATTATNEPVAEPMPSAETAPPVVEGSEPNPTTPTAS
jgi:hypothetical protein